ncbi:MAG: hypothetical protein CMJ48_11795 [Planctomycetaceae bacterium]|nr:hypothetical protein [Planctomycetaceae bacterium]
MDAKKNYERLMELGRRQDFYLGFPLEILLGHGIASLETGEFTAAERDFVTARERYRGFFEPGLLLGKTYYRQGEEEEAESFFKKLFKQTELKEEKDEAALRISLLYDSLAESHRALEWAERVDGQHLKSRVIARCYARLNQFEKAIEMQRRMLVDLGLESTEEWIELGQLLLHNLWVRRRWKSFPGVHFEREEFLELNQISEEVLELEPENSSARALRIQVLLAQGDFERASSELGDWALPPTRGSEPAVGRDGWFGEVRRLENPEVNSPFREEVQAVSADGLELYFTSNDRPEGRGGWDLYVATRDAPDQLFRDVRNIVELNTPESDDSCNLSADGSELYFVRDWVDLYVATRQAPGERFTEPRELAVNTEFRESSPIVSADGLELYFLSNREGTRALYVVTRSGLGEPFGADARFIQERSKSFGYSLSTDGLTLFFDSKTKKTRQLWMATRERKTDETGNFVAFGEPVNLGSRVNTAAFEGVPAISADWPLPKSTLYFVRGTPYFPNLDIYQATWHPP